MKLNIKSMLIIISILLVFVLGLSYATFVITSDGYKATEMLISNLAYAINIEKVSGEVEIDGMKVI